MHLLIGAGVGWVVGCFTPAVCRKVKALFVKEAKAVEAKGAAGVAAEVKKVL